MGGKSSFSKFERRESLSRKQAMEAQCYECNGYSFEKVDDCKGFNCPLYQWSPWGTKSNLQNVTCSGSISHIKDSQAGGSRKIGPKGSDRIDAFSSENKERP